MKKSVLITLGVVWVVMMAVAVAVLLFSGSGPQEIETSPDQQMAANAAPTATPALPDTPAATEISPTQQTETSAAPTATPTLPDTPTPEPTPTETAEQRFERLSAREQRLGIPVQRGTPLMLDPDSIPAPLPTE
jgi:cytoskeletal protein RodZ